MTCFNCYAECSYTEYSGNLNSDKTGNILIRSSEAVFLVMCDPSMNEL